MKKIEEERDHRQRAEEQIESHRRLLDEKNSIQVHLLITYQKITRSIFMSLL